MQIHRVRGNDIKDALQRARRTYGEGAMVISQEASPDGGITLAVAKREASAEAEAMESVAPKVEPMSFPSESGLPQGYEEVRARLLRTGCSEAWSRRLCLRAAEQSEVGDHPMDSLCAAIGIDARISKLPRAPGVTRVIAFVGQTGVGKTTGLVKLGARLIKGKRRVSLATLDSRRVGAVEQLRAYGALLGASLEVIPSNQELTPERLGVIGNEIVLLDTTGQMDSDPRRLVRFHDLLTSGNRMTRLDAFLVLPATSSREALREVTESYCDVPLAGCIITKLDETRCPSAAIEHVIELGLPLAFLSDGQDIGRDFHRVTKERLADLLLLGRME
ncbi:MAG: flagellar biosynthesis GTPase FlhF [Planctomycetota bacterium]|jgi:flagellar biosynthesis GTPase FlhF